MNPPNMKPIHISEFQPSFPETLTPTPSKKQSRLRGSGGGTGVDDHNKLREKESSQSQAPCGRGGMVSVSTMTWLSDLGNRVGIGHHHHNHHKRYFPPILGILAFEAARTMARLVSLYKSLYEDEILKLRKDIMRSEGVTYLTSKDEGFLLKLACAERMEALDRAAISVARLGKKCSDPALTNFEYAYADMKLGFVDLAKMEFGSKEIEKIIDKMTSYISSTSNLYTGLESLAELESVERNSKKRWKNHHKSGLVMAVPKVNTEFTEEKLACQKQQVQHLKDVSLWSKTFDKSVGLMARIVCVVYARICGVFGPYFAVLPSTRHVRYSSMHLQFQFIHHECHELQKGRPKLSRSVPILQKHQPKQGMVRLLTREEKPVQFQSENIGFRVGIKDNLGFGWVEKTTWLMHQAPPNSVGGSGLALRYANVIMLMENFLESPSSLTDYAREDLYQMLPAGLKRSVRLKLKKLLRTEEMFGKDDSLADGWRDGLKVILGWLTPPAHNTVRWMSERNFEKQNFDWKPKVLLLQTLFFADKVKTEAAIVEVLVGLSCICRIQCPVLSD